MLEWIITSCALIAIIIALRYALRGRISLRLQYALWALALVRLLVPISFGSSPISVLNTVQSVVEAPAAGRTSGGGASRSFTTPAPFAPESAKPQAASSDNSPVFPGGTAKPAVNAETAKPAPVMPGTVNGDNGNIGGNNGDNFGDNGSIGGDSGGRPAAKPLDTAKLFTIIWLAGSAVVFCIFIVTNASVAVKLGKSRKRLENTDCDLPVYVSDALSTPCLFGILSPAVYVTSEAAADERKLRHVIAHERTHARHFDHVFSVLRGLCVALHWYNPLVWLAAVLSRRDQELACDEGAIARIGEGERAEYGRTLIDLTCQRAAGILTAATTMTASKRSIRERIVLIAKKPHMTKLMLASVLIAAAIAIGCTFTGAAKPRDAYQSGADGLITPHPTAAPSEEPTEEPTEAPSATHTSEPAPTPDPAEGEYAKCIALIYPDIETHKQAVEGIHDIDPFSVRFMLPDGWKIVPFRPVENQIYLMGWHPGMSPLSCLKWLEDENGNCVGAFGFDVYGEYDSVPAEDYHKAVYSFLNGSGARLDFNDYYTPVENEWENVTAISMARYSGSSYLNAYIPGSPDIDNPAILSYLDSRHVYFAMELDNSIDEAIVNAIAQSLCILENPRLATSGNTRFIEYGSDAVIDEAFEQFDDVARLHGLELSKNIVSVESYGYNAAECSIVFHDKEFNGSVAIGLSIDGAEIAVDYSSSRIRFEYDEELAQFGSDTIGPVIDIRLGSFSSVTDPAIGETIAARIADYIVNGLEEGHPYKGKAAKAVKVRPIVMEEDRGKYDITIAFLPENSRAYVLGINPDCDFGLYGGESFPECKGWLRYCCEADAKMLFSGEWECMDIYPAAYGGASYSCEPIYTEPWFVENAWYLAFGKARANGIELMSANAHDFSMDDERAVVSLYDESENAATVEFIRQPSGIFKTGEVHFEFANTADYPDPEMALREAVINLGAHEAQDPAILDLLGIELVKLFTAGLSEDHPASGTRAYASLVGITGCVPDAPADHADITSIGFYIEIALDPRSMAEFCKAFKGAYSFNTDYIYFDSAYEYADLPTLSLTANAALSSGGEWIVSDLAPSQRIEGMSRAEQFPLAFGSTGGVQVLSVPSERFEAWEIDEAIRCAIERFERCYTGCTLVSIGYAGDALNAQREHYQVDPTLDTLIKLECTFTVAPFGADPALEPDTTYPNWSFVFAKHTDSGSNYPWEFVTNGY